MYHPIFKAMLLFISTTAFSPCFAAETNSATLPKQQAAAVQKQDSAKVEPKIKAQYYSAETVVALPRLKPLASQEPEFNKIIFKLDGYPKNREITLEIKRMASLEPKVYEPKVTFVIQDDGSMLLNNTRQPLKALISSSKGFLPGERVFYRFRTNDGSVDKEISGIPAPAVVKNKEEKPVIKAELLSVNPTVYSIDLPALKEGEEVDIKSTSLGAINTAKYKYSPKQPFRYAPGGDNKAEGGEATLEVKQKSGESYKIKLPWGSALDNYLKGSKAFSPN